MTLRSSVSSRSFIHLFAGLPVSLFVRGSLKSGSSVVALLFLVRSFPVVKPFECRLAVAIMVQVDDDGEWLPSSPHQTNVSSLYY